MAIDNNSFKVLRLDLDYSPLSRESIMSSDEDEATRSNSALESDQDDEFDDSDSGAGSDDFNLLELGKTGAEFCQIGNQTCSIPLELYDLTGLEDILSVDVWNEYLTEEERFELAKYLPDMDQETFVRSMKELLTGCNFHFGSPIKKLFDMLKGGLCEPRVALYKEGLKFFQKRQHYHWLRKHQNDMVNNLCQVRDAWLNCRGYSIEEKLRVLNIMRSQKSLIYEKTEDSEVDSSNENSGEGIWNRKNKDRKGSQKSSRYSFHRVGSGLEIHPTGHLSSIYHGALDVNPGLNASTTALSQHNKPVGYNSGASFRMRDSLSSGDDGEEMSYGRSVYREHNVLGRNLMNKSGVLRVRKRCDLLRINEIDADNLMGLPLSAKADLHIYKRNAKQSPDMKIFIAKPSSKRGSLDLSGKAKFPEKLQQSIGSYQKKTNLRGLQLPLKGNLVGSSDYNELFYNKMPGEHFSIDSSFKYDDCNPRGNKCITGRVSPDPTYAPYRSTSSHVSDRLLSSDFRAKSLQQDIRGNFMQNGRKDIEALRGNHMFLRGEETESDSSEQMNVDEDNNHLMQREFAYLMGPVDGSPMKSLKSHLVRPKKAKFASTDMKAHATTQSKRKGGVAGHIESKAKQKGKILNGGSLHNLAGNILEQSYHSGSDMLNEGDDDWRQEYNIGKNGRMRGEPIGRLDMPLSNAYSAEREKKGKTGPDHSILRSKYSHDYMSDEEDLLLKNLLVDDNGYGKSRLGRKGKKYVAYKGNESERSQAPLLGCNSAKKKRKLKDAVADLVERDDEADLLSNTLPQTDDSIFSSRKSNDRGQRKLKKIKEAKMLTTDVENSEPHVTDKGTAEMELKTKPQKKQFTLITPTVHTGFSFSIIHLLSAVRMAMITPLAEDSLEMEKPREDQNKAHEGIINAVLSDDKVIPSCEPADQLKKPSFTVQEIVNRVRSNPGDPCILETHEPLQDLVRGVLKIFSSKAAPLGAKGWKVVALYDKSTRSWSWTGPVSQNSSDHDAIEEVTTPEAWGLPHKMLVKLVDSFANWLKCGQETLQQLGSLPEPPLALMQVNLDEKERFRDLKAQKSLNTIGPSSEEVRTYFRKEEVLRYLIPDRAFSYTAADGKKSIVAPLRRCCGKPTSKARDHFMLKRDRPPHVTILCLVRDAAARLPGSIGTRADVGTLIRDSQYIVEDVTDVQINHVISGALDRLHSERDPCVQFDGERKLWVYLHREREEEDFEDDGTSSTKKWRRQKKDVADQPDQATITAAQEQSGYDLDPPGIDDEKGMELLPNDTRPNAEDVDVKHALEESNVCEGNSMVWEALDSNPPREDC